MLLATGFFNFKFPGGPPYYTGMERQIFYFPPQLFERLKSKNTFALSTRGISSFG